MLGYLYMVLVTISFSFGGALVKTASGMVNAAVISFSRFFVGVLFLLIYQLVRRQKPNIRLLCGPVLFGAACKALNYLTENYGLEHGFTFGNIIVWPVQCIVVLLVSIFFFKEKVHLRQIVGVLLCVFGVAMISLNGQSLTSFGGENLFFTLLFVVSGVGAAGFIVAQRLLLNKMDSANMNLSMFLVAVGITAAPLPFTGEVYSGFSWTAFAALVLFGIVTGCGFLLVAEAMKTVPLFMITIIQSSTVLFTLLWAVLFYHEPVTRWILAGTGVFLLGMLAVNLKGKPKQA